MVLEHNPHLTQSVTATHLIDKSQLQSTLLSISRECCQLDRVLMTAHVKWEMCSKTTFSTTYSPPSTNVTPISVNPLYIC